MTDTPIPAGYEVFDGGGGGTNLNPTCISVNYISFDILNLYRTSV